MPGWCLGEAVSFPRHQAPHAHLLNEACTCDANKFVITRMFDEAAKTVRRVYSDIDSSIEADDTTDLVLPDPFCHRAGGSRNFHPAIVTGELEVVFPRGNDGDNGRVTSRGPVSGWW